MTLSPQEQRLQNFCWIFSGVYFFGALFFAAFPGLTFRIASFGGESALLSPETRFWNSLGVAMMIAVAVACAVTASRPRERRHALLPVVAAKLTSSGIALVHLTQVSGPGTRALWSVFCTDLPLFLLTLWIYRSASPGVHSAPATQLPVPEVKPAGKPIQLGLGKGPGRKAD